ncbi:MAG: hypothetical protein GC157_06670 [Frankiales bacterium]|nr:hypothetical protein [Frankiales bacterium]
MRRVFWVTVGAVAGYYAARKGAAVVEEARERGVVGNVTLAASTATKVATTASRLTLAAGEALGSRTRALAEGREASAPPAPSPAPAPRPIER